MTTTPIPTGPTGPTGAAGPNKLLIALIAVGSVLLLVIVGGAFFLIGQSNGNGSAGGNDNAGAPTPLASQTPGSESTDTPDDPTGDGGDAPVDTSVRFTNFSADLTVECDPTGQADEKAQPSISWSSANAIAVYWTPSDREANSENGYQVGPSGNQNDMSDSKGPGERYEFPCNHDQFFDTTITLVGANGEKVSKSVTFEDVNWQ